MTAHGHRDQDGEEPTAHACDDCLRRSRLIARLAGAIEIARHEKRRLRELLAMPNERLIATLGGPAAAALAEEVEGDAEPVRAAAAEAGLVAVCRHDERYPARMRDLNDRPAVLFVAAADGALDRLERIAGGRIADDPVAVAIVGTRRASADGEAIARALGRGLGAAGVGVVSGMALGIDSAAHVGALDVGAPTIAVLAGGAETPYPASKRWLHKRIVASCCVVSEMPPGFTPYKWCFPARNRIIAALAQMTVVVEAAERSGSLITAEAAADLGRDIGAVPGAVTSWRSHGTNALLRDGAIVVRDATDVLDAVVGLDAAKAALDARDAARGTADRAAGLDARLASVLHAVVGGRDTLAALSGTPDQAEATLAALTELELQGRLRRVAGGRYVVVPPW